MKVAVESLKYIQHLVHLTSLTLNNLPIRNGQFLIPILQNCKVLKRIRLKDLGPGGLCCYIKQLGQALQFCHQLVDLRVEQNSLAPCRELFQSIRNNCQRLERIALISPSPGYTSYNSEDIQELIRGVCTLVFAYFRTAYLTQRDEILLQRLTKKLQRGRPELFVLASGSELTSTKKLNVPICHLTEMVDINSWTRYHNLQ